MIIKRTSGVWEIDRNSIPYHIDPFFEAIIIPGAPELCIAFAGILDSGDDVVVIAQWKIINGHSAYWCWDTFHASYLKHIKLYESNTHLYKQLNSFNCYNKKYNVGTSLTVI